MSSKKVISILLLTVLFAMCSCNNASQVQTTNGDGMQGTIRVSGAFALYPMMVKWAEEFQKLHPGVRIDVSAGGAGKGAADALAGLVDIGMISREIKQEEIDQGAYFIPVVKDAVFPVMNKDNPLLSEIEQKGIKKNAFKGLWIDGTIKTWGEMIGTSSAELVSLYTRSDSCGAAETWAKYIGNAAQEDLLGVGVYADPGLAEAVRNDALGIGYNNLNYAFDFNTGLPVEGIRVIPIDVNENGMVDEEEELDTKEKAITAVQTNAYPSPPARDLYLMTKGSFNGVTKEFVKYILTEGQQYVEETGYITLRTEQISDALNKI